MLESFPLLRWHMTVSVMNLTPHAVTLRGDGGDVVFAPSGEVARVVTTSGGEAVTVDGLGPVLPSEVTEGVEGLPDPEDGKVFLVSGFVLANVKGRADVFAPATGPRHGVVRDDKGRIKAVTKFLAAPK